MSRNGAGTYSLPAGNPVVTGTTISSTWANTTLSDIGTALTASIANDGQTPILANLPMSGFKHTGVAVAAALTDYARTDQVQNSAFQWLSSVAGTDTITANATPTPSAYAAGQTFRFVSAGANTGAATLNVSSLGAKAITKNGATALVAGDIPSGAVIRVTYDGTQFQLASVKVLTAGTDFIAPGAITSSGLTQSTGKMLGRSTAATGAIEEITVGSNLTLSGGTLSASGGISNLVRANKNGTGQTVNPANAATQVTFGTVEFDTGSNYATNTYTAPATGKYVFGGQVTWTSLAANTICIVAIYKGGVELYRNSSASGNLTADCSVHVPGDVMSLAANDAITIYSWTNNGGSLTVSGSTRDTFFTAMRVA